MARSVVTVVPLFVEAVIVFLAEACQKFSVPWRQGTSLSPSRGDAPPGQAGAGRGGGWEPRKEPPAAPGSGGARLPPGARPRGRGRGGGFGQPVGPPGSRYHQVVPMPRCGGGTGVHTPPCSRGRAFSGSLSPRDGPSVARGHAGATCETPSRTPGTDQHAASFFLSEAGKDWRKNWRTYIKVRENPPVLRGGD